MLLRRRVYQQSLPQPDAAIHDQSPHYTPPPPYSPSPKINTCSRTQAGICVYLYHPQSSIIFLLPSRIPISLIPASQGIGSHTNHQSHTLRYVLSIYHAIFNMCWRYNLS
ncbi:hypothetical protein FRC03_006612 [Tulasnella sp. 419]|nr:hypothetical protein FRC03_006612 [Tulasnella sp. 419]